MKHKQKAGSIRLPSVMVNGIEFVPKVTPDTLIGAIAGAYYILGTRLSLTFAPVKQHTKGGLK